MLRRLIAGAFALGVVLSPLAALAQSSPGTSPLSGYDGGTGNGFMQFTGPASPIKTFTLPNVSDTIVLLTQAQTLTNKTISGSSNTIAEIANVSLSNMAAYTIKGNSTSSAAAPTDISIPALTHKSSPASTDKIMISDSAASGALKYATIAETVGALASGVSSLDSKTGAFTSGNGLESTGSNVLQLTPARRTLPTTQVFAGGTSGTYTTPSNVLWIEIVGIGAGGGGGGGQNTSAASTGGSTCWNTSGAACTTPVFQASAGTGGASIAPGTGGSVSGSGTAFLAMAGQGGGTASIPGVGANAGGGVGGSSGCGGSGGAGSIGNSAAIGPTGFGGGGGGGGATNGTLTGSGGYGGGGGACFHAIINSPAASYTYAVGAGGSGAAGGSSSSSVGGAGAVGAPGRLIIIEHYGS